ncbi:MAG: NUDIX hydrolase [Candidatus Nanoarchaeia archaeon]|nr:NUDIX hydrolase [Candidatus Nanoarchaeia archaeon]MDD5239387.1 NUDIX hydrolase [Candidatus Nanoarchaeia archaeon]
MSFEYLQFVVNAVIHRGGKVLIGKKIDGPHPANLGGKWHFPGGRVEPGEKPEDAIVREMKEETGLDIEVKRFFDVMVLRQYVNNKRGVVVFAWYLVEPKDDKTAAPSDDLQEIKWVSKNEAMGYFPDNFVEHIPWNAKEFLLDK